VGDRARGVKCREPDEGLGKTELGSGPKFSKKS
jgi:hypothetical protein